ncbi:MAG: Holliday junction branch migration protein RuvA [Bacteroidales bacterium]|nr:Holliday junction branch migration protein RuvA [Bacteroidales bacterium]
MYNYIRGKLDEATPAYAVIDCGGVGYLLEITINTYSQIKELKEVKLLVHEIVREDAHLLFGFYSEAEREMFRLLISVNGVGAATARIMLSSLTVDELTRAILDQDAKRVQKVKGIGAKTAQRILLELRDKVDPYAIQTLTGDTSPMASNNKNVEEALSALVMLGFPKAASEKVVTSVASANPSATVEEIIKLTLAHGI